MKNIFSINLQTNEQECDRIICRDTSDKIKEETNIAEELGADSLDLVEILMSLEDEFGISIPDEAIPNIKTIKDIVAFIEKNKK